MLRIGVRTMEYTKELLQALQTIYSMAYCNPRTKNKEEKEAFILVSELLCVIANETRNKE